MTIKELIKGCQKEDIKCQKELYDRFAPKMLVVCSRYARHQMEAEDILQEGFIKIFDHIQQFKNKGSFEGWIRRIMINTALKNYKKSSYQKEKIGLEDYDVEIDYPDAVSRISEKELLKMLESLPDGYRVVFNLYAIEGFSHKEIGEKLGINESTSRSQLVKARKALQMKIMQQEKICYEGPK